MASASLDSISSVTTTMPLHSARAPAQEIAEPFVQVLLASTPSPPAPPRNADAPNPPPPPAEPSRRAAEPPRAEEPETSEKASTDTEVADQPADDEEDTDVAVVEPRVATTTDTAAEETQDECEAPVDEVVLTEEGADAADEPRIAKPQRSTKTRRQADAAHEPTEKSTKTADEEAPEIAAELPATEQPPSSAAAEVVNREGPPAESSPASRRDDAVVVLDADMKKHVEPAGESEQTDGVAEPAGKARTANETGLGDTVSSEEGEPRRAKKSLRSGAAFEAAPARSKAPANAGRPADPVASPVADVAAAPAVDATMNSGDTSSTASSSLDARPAEGPTPTSPTQRLPEHLLARGSRQAPPAPMLTQAEQTRFVQRVAGAIEAARSRDGQVRLRLSPPELGSLKLEVKVEDGVLRARIETENAIAKTALVENFPALRDRLAEQGIRIEQFEVDVFDQRGGDSASQDFQQDKSPSENRPRSVLASRTTESNNRTPPAPPNETVGRSLEQLNIIG